MSCLFIKNNDYETLREIKGHSCAGYPFLNLIFIYGKCRIKRFIEITLSFITEPLTRQSLNCKVVPVHEGM